AAAHRRERAVGDDADPRAHADGAGSCREDLGGVRCDRTRVRFADEPARRGEDLDRAGHVERLGAVVGEDRDRPGDGASRAREGPGHRSASYGCPPVAAMTKSRQILPRRAGYGSGTSLISTRPRSGGRPSAGGVAPEPGKSPASAPTNPRRAPAARATPSSTLDRDPPLAAEASSACPSTTTVR